MRHLCELCAPGEFGAKARPYQPSKHAVPDRNTPTWWKNLSIVEGDKIVFYYHVGYETAVVLAARASGTDLSAATRASIGGMADTATIPEPAALTLILVGLGFLGVPR